MANQVSALTVMSSNSGVRNIRAMFEAKSEYTSPPSRGRSPVGSEGTGTRSTSSRPLSKVRTSFVAVERSGQLGPQLGLRRMSSSGDAISGVDPGSEAKIDKLSEMARPETPKTNGNGNGTTDISTNGVADSAPSSSVLEKVKEEETTTLPRDNSHYAFDGDRDRPIDGPISSSNIEDTGKKSSFNPEESTDTPTIQESQSSNADAKDITTPNKANTAQKGTPATKSVSPTKSKSFTSRPLPIRTKNDIGGSPQVKKSGETSKVSNSPRTPKTPASSSNQPHKVSSPRQPLSSTNSPKHPISGNGGKRLSEPNKEPTRKTSRASIASTATIKQQTSTSTVPSRKPTSSLATSASAKPRPKSPTRPARLPAAATAATAASAAKTGGLPASRSPSRTGSTIVNRKSSTVNKDVSNSRLRGPQTTSTTAKTTRPPPGSNAAAERPKSRSAVGKAPDEGFLARMMRPTASSASKVHDKTDQKSSPPRKGPTGKPKRKSDGTDVVKLKDSEPPMPAESQAEESNSINAPAEKDSAEEVPAAVDDMKESGTSTEPLAT